MYSMSIRDIVDLLKDEKAFLSLQELKDRFNVKTNCLDLYGLQLSVQLLGEKCKDNQCADTRKIL